jgi:pyruvate dehydrogenase E1 component
VAQWIPGPVHCLGTDGFGRSDGREALRDFFEVDARYITLAALHQLVASGDISKTVLAKAIKNYKIDPDKLNPHKD